MYIFTDGQLKKVMVDHDDEWLIMIVDRDDEWLMVDG